MPRDGEEQENEDEFPRRENLREENDGVDEKGGGHQEEKRLPQLLALEEAGHVVGKDREPWGGGGRLVGGRGQDEGGENLVHVLHVDRAAINILSQLGQLVGSQFHLNLVN